MGINKYILITAAWLAAAGFVPVYADISTNTAETTNSSQTNNLETIANTNTILTNTIETPTNVITETEDTSQPYQRDNNDPIVQTIDQIIEIVKSNATEIKTNLPLYNDFTTYVLTFEQESRKIKTRYTIEYIEAEKPYLNIISLISDHNH